MDTYEEQLIRATFDKTWRRIDVGHLYAKAILSNPEFNAEMVNAAIVRRWSKSGLEFVKKVAWERIKRDQSSGTLREAPPCLSQQSETPANHNTTD